MYVVNENRRSKIVFRFMALNYNSKSLFKAVFYNNDDLNIYLNDLGGKNYICNPVCRKPKANAYLNARMAKLVNVAVSEAVENCLLRVRVSLRAHP
jgi:hypothetical protein